MSIDVKGASQELVSEFEDAAFKELFPWRCYQDNLQYSQDFKSLEEASNAFGVKPADIEQAMLNNQGHVGNLVFVRQ